MRLIDLKRTVGGVVTPVWPPSWASSVGDGRKVAVGAVGVPYYNRHSRPLLLPGRSSGPSVTPLPCVRRIHGRLECRAILEQQRLGLGVQFFLDSDFIARHSVVAHRGHHALDLGSRLA